MSRKDMLFDSPFGVVKIWEPERQFSPATGSSAAPFIKVVVVEPWTGGNVQREVVQARPFELRLRGFCTKGSEVVKPEDPPAPRMKDLLYIAQKEIAELEDAIARSRTALQDAIDCWPR